MERHIRWLKFRTIFSAVLYAAFIVVGVIFGMQGATAHQPTPLIVLLLTAYFALPRRTLPRGYKPETSEEQARAELLDEWRKRFVWTRLAYFAGAIFILAILPSII